MIPLSKSFAQVLKTVYTEFSNSQIKETKMLDIQLKQIVQLSQMLDKWGVPHKIMLPDGKEFGALEVVTKKTRARAPSPYPIGTLKNYFLPFVKDLQPGEVAAIPAGEFDLEVLRGSLAGWASREWGIKTNTSCINRISKTIEILRLS